MRLLFSLCLVLAGPALAQSPRETLFPSDASCYLRYYNAEHMAKHPAQTVELIQVGPDQTQWQNDELVLKIGLDLRSASGQLLGYAYCTPAGKGLTCAMEGDAGSFQLTPARDGAIRIDIGPDGVSFEGDSGFVTLEGNSGDDRSFVMPPVPADACP